MYIYLTNGKNWVSAPKIIPVVGIWPYLPRAIGAWWFPGEGGRQDLHIWKCPKGPDLKVTAPL